MKNLSKSLQLHKRSIQILDDKALVDLRGGAAHDCTCNEESCNVQSCACCSCNARIN